VELVFVVCGFKLKKFVGGIEESFLVHLIFYQIIEF
jgi:hypothetical protein